MTPQPSIAHYKVLAKLGEGGMGAVYRATDTKLNRDVALKVLPDSFAADPDRMARFQREAQLLASLNHPNIAAIYGVEEGALVLELVEGETLAERIARGPLSAEEALPLIEQLIDALEYAHDKAIIHRDLKPANIKITPQGRLKVLDFGLAKALGLDPSASSSPANSPTLTMRATVAGVIMGTAAYMSPEQARGQEVDRRADNWSFGVVVYEMLRGRLLFEAPTISDTLAAVLTRDPDVAAVPPRFHRLLRSCLTRDPRHRLAHISGARLLLEEPAPAAVPPQRRPIAAWILAGGAILLAIVLAVLRIAAPGEPQRPIRLTMPAPDNAEFVGYAPSVSPDGRIVMFVASTGGKAQIWLRSLEESAPHALAGTEDSSFPFWSPDSRWIGFFARGKLKKVALEGGPSVELCDARNARGGAWSAGGTVVFANSPTGPLQRVSASGGVPIAATEFDSEHKEFSHRLPHFLPDGRHYLFLIRSNDPRQVGVYAADLESRERRLVLPGAVDAHYTPPGYLLFVRDGVLLAQPFDASSLRLSGEPSPLAEHVDVSMTNSLALVSASQTGVIAYYSGGVSNDTQLTWLDASGKVSGTLGPRAGHISLAISPDGKFVAESRQDPRTGAFHVYVDDLVHGTDLRLTPEETNAVIPVWSPDSRHIVYISGQQNLSQSAVMLWDAGGSGEATKLPEHPGLARPVDWSRDGRYILFDSGPPGMSGSLWVLPMSGLTPGKPYPYLETGSGASIGMFSPDGRWVVYESSRDGAADVYVQSFPEKHGPIRISTGGGSNPIWSADGRRLFFLHASTVMAVDVLPVGTNFEHGVPRALFAAPVNIVLNEQRHFALSPDGKLFLVMAIGGTSTTRLNLILNWPALLRK